MRPSDIEAIAELLGEAADGTGGIAQDTHEAIASRAFRATGALGRPVQRIHDTIAGSVYGGVRLGLRTGARQAGRALARRVPADAPALGDGPGEAIALGAIAGFAGDLLAERGSPLAPSLGLRACGRHVEPTAAELAAAYPHPSRRLAVFVHGLCETEYAWNGLPKPRERGARRAAELQARERASPAAAPSTPLADDPARAPDPAASELPPAPAPGTMRPASFPARLETDLGVTALLIRMNSGRHISDNARDLAALLGEVIEQWPVPPNDVILVGHSMGGLIARSAVWQARDEPWTRLARHVICLGTPHHGADLEQGVHLLDWALGQTPETRAFSKALRLRSAGIKDLRFGSASEEDWLDQDPDELLRRRAAEVPFLPHTEYSWISASLTRGTVGRLVGDLLVREPSASGSGRGHHVPFDLDNGATLHGLTHFDLLDHPEVYDQMLAWLTRPARLPAKTSS